MKKWIHPVYYAWDNATPVTCICGHSFPINSTVQWPIKLENCPNCHPTYTGKEQKIVVKWRMEKFLEKQKRMEAMKKAA